jgi:hypothetical protein
LPTARDAISPAAPGSNNGEGTDRMELLVWLEDTAFSTWLRESDWAHPIVLCFHAVGMGLVVGVSFMLCARVLGYSKAFPLSGFDRLFSIAWFGFAMNAVSGIVLYIGEPGRLLTTPAFLIKMVLIVLAGFSLWVLTRALYGGEGEEREPLAVTSAAKIAAVFPIVLWLGAIVAGRLIGYTIAPPPA